MTVAPSLFSAKKFIAAKRDGNAHDETELRTWLNCYLQNSVPDYQMAAWLMAVFFRGMTGDELSVWTDLMTNSGAKLPRKLGDGFFVDKHSTGGVGDKPSLLLVPLVISVANRLWGKGRLRIPMMSGRGLGHSGGTLDKLDSIPGFRSKLVRDEAMKLFDENHYVMMGQTEDLAPADRRLYSLRDVTATVESLPLIVSSILSKKLAESLDGLVLDVKFGPGAFMADKSSAERLAKLLVEVAEKRGVRTVAWLTRMDEPLGFSIGNALEIQECIDFLSGVTRELGLEEVTLNLAATMLEISSKGELSFSAAMRELQKELMTERPFAVFEQMVCAQGGSLSAFEAERAAVPKAYQVLEFRAAKGGWLKAVDARALGEMALVLGAGREQQDATIDAWAGMQLLKKVGDKVTAGEVLCDLYFKRSIDVDVLKQRLSVAFVVGGYEVKPVPWCVERLG